MTVSNDACGIISAKDLTYLIISDLECTEFDNFSEPGFIINEESLAAFLNEKTTEVFGTLVYEYEDIEMNSLITFDKADIEEIIKRDFDSKFITLTDIITFSASGAHFECELAA